MFLFHRYHADPSSLVREHLNPSCTAEFDLPVGLVECNKETVAMVRTASLL
jgi:hypothetical protein